LQSHIFRNRRTLKELGSTLLAEKLVYQDHEASVKAHIYSLRSGSDAKPSMRSVRNLSRLLFCLAIGASLLEIILNFGRIWPDSPAYITLAETHVAPTLGYRVRFALPFLLSPIISIMGAQVAFGIANGLFWLAGLAIIYKTSLLIADKELGALVGAFYSTSVPMIAFGASVLTEPAAYFFVGLSLYALLLMSKQRLRPSMLALIGVILASGVLFHPVTVLGLVYVTIGLALLKRLSVWFLGGIAAVALAMVPVAALIGISDAPSALIYTYFNPQWLMAPMMGPPLVDAIPWTFGITAPLDLVLYSRFFINGTHEWRSILRLILVLGIMGIGLKGLRERAILLGYVPFLAVYVFAAHWSIERFLFVLWPVFSFPLVAGICGIVRFATSMLRDSHSLANVGGRSVFSNPVLYAMAYILFQGVQNSLWTIPFLGVPWLADAFNML